MNYNQQLRWVVDAVIAGYNGRNVSDPHIKNVRNVAYTMRERTNSRSFHDVMLDFELYLLQIERQYTSTQQYTVSATLQGYLGNHMRVENGTHYLVRDYKAFATLRNMLLMWSHEMGDLEAVFTHLSAVHGTPREATQYLAIMTDMALSLYEAAHVVAYDDDTPWAWQSPLLYATWKDRLRIRDDVDDYLAPVYEVVRAQEAAQQELFDRYLEKGRMRTLDSADVFMRSIPPGTAKTAPNINYLLRGRLAP